MNANAETPIFARQNRTVVNRAQHPVGPFYKTLLRPTQYLLKITRQIPMTKTLLSLFLLAFAFTTFAQSADETAIKDVITSAYIEGIQNHLNVDDIRKGFHPSFTMLRIANNEVKPLPIEEWITNMEKPQKNNPATPPRTDGKFISIDITGTAAVVKLELTREGKKTFTDYLVLAKFTEGWRIISKSFYRYP
jgi:hypothetical protein